MARIIDLDSMESEQVNINVDLLHIGDVSDETTIDKKITVAKFHATAPAATATTKGAVSASSQTIGGVKTFADGIVVDNIQTGSGLDLTSFTRFLVVAAAPAVADMAERTLYLVNTVNDIYTGYYLIVDGNDRSRGQIGGRSYTGGTGISVNESTAVITNTLADQGGTIGGNATVSGDLTVEGDIYQNGTAYETHAEKLYTKKDMIITRDGAQSALATGDLSGIKAEHYDANGNNGVLGFDNSGTARVGDEGDTQPLLTRSEEADLTDKNLFSWDGTNKKAAGITNASDDNSVLKARVTNGAVSGYDWVNPSNEAQAVVNALSTRATAIADTDKVIIKGTDSNGVKPVTDLADYVANRLGGSNNLIVANSTTISGVELYTNFVMKVLFTANIAGVDTSTALSITYNGTAIPVKVYKEGVLSNFTAAKISWLASSAVYRYIDAGITIDLFYDGTNFVIIGDPIVLKSNRYSIHADGSVEGGAVGDVKPIALTSISYGWLECNGQAVSRSEYAGLFAFFNSETVVVDGVTKTLLQIYGEGDQSTTFNLPDYREVALVGAGQNDTDSALATHDIYTVGKFKDDQLQNHGHLSYWVESDGIGILNQGSGYKFQNQVNMLFKANATGRTGSTTHGKQKGVKYIIKAL